MAIFSKIFKAVGVAITVTVVSCSHITMKALVLTTKGSEITSIKNNFKSYGIPFDVVEFSAASPFTGNLVLYNKSNEPKYNLVVISGSELTYQLSDGTWGSALNPDQWAYLEKYEAQNSIRRVVIGDDISNKVDVTLYDPTKWGESSSNQPLVVEPSEEVKTIFNQARIKITAPLDVNDIYHSKVKIVDTTTTRPFLHYKGTDGAVAATISKYNDGREVMRFFFGLGTWSQSSTMINHLWLTWGTRALFNGFRRVYFTPHIDDVLLGTELVNPKKDQTFGGETYRMAPFDFQKIAEFQKDVLKIMPKGSFYRSELAINGNGVLISGDYTQSISLDTARHHDEEWVKKPGTGDQRWPHPNYQFSKAQRDTFKKDPVYNYFYHNVTAQKEFFWSSHTFTHENLDELHTTDVDNEIRLNIELAKEMGLVDTEYWSAGSIITPQISGLHNKDALDVFRKYGIQSATGDLSRPALCNTENPYLPFFTTKESSNLAGFPIIPRTPTEMYYFCSTRDENIWMYNHIYAEVLGKKHTYNEFLERESQRTLLLMTQLRHEAHQFHQANLRYFDKGKGLGSSLLEDWTRAFVNLYTKYVDWPLISLKIDKQAEVFTERAKLEACGAKAKLIIENNSVVGVTVSASKGDCTVPVTLPGKAASIPKGSKTEQVGNDPLTVWVPLKKGQARTLKLKKAIAWAVDGSNNNAAAANTATVVKTTTVVVPKVDSTTTTTTTTTTTAATTTAVVKQMQNTTTVAKGNNKKLTTTTVAKGNNKKVTTTTTTVAKANNKKATTTVAKGNNKKVTTTTTTVAKANNKKATTTTVAKANNKKATTTVAKGNNKKATTTTTVAKANNKKATTTTVAKANDKKATTTVAKANNKKATTTVAKANNKKATTTVAKANNKKATTTVAKANNKKASTTVAKANNKKATTTVAKANNKKATTTVAKANNKKVTTTAKANNKKATTTAKANNKKAATKANNTKQAKKN